MRCPMRIPLIDRSNVRGMAVTLLPRPAPYSSASREWQLTMFSVKERSYRTWTCGQKLLRESLRIC